MRIGTRGSPLALVQARDVQAKLMAAHGLDADAFPLTVLTTSGDRIRGELSAWGGKGLFTRELERALLSGEIDIAVHSMKDVPTHHQPELGLAAILKREDPRDAFISIAHDSFVDLLPGATVGSASIRRRAQGARLRPDLNFQLLRGNVGTRLDKLRDGHCEATFLAVAGLRRLKQVSVIKEHIEPEIMLPAPAQGAVGIETRLDNDFARGLCAELNHAETALCIGVERAFLEALDGSCRTPIAALAERVPGGVSFRGEVLAMDGSRSVSRSVLIPTHDRSEAMAEGLRIGREVRAEAGDLVDWL